MKEKFINLKFNDFDFNQRRMLRPSCLQDEIDYLDYMIDFYYSVVIELKKVQFKDEFRAEFSVILQMMFTKAKTIRGALEGFFHNQNQYYLNNIIDHTMIFSMLRTVYELLLAFELICIFPDTEDKRLILRNAYIAAGLINRQKFIKEKSTEEVVNVLLNESKIIEQCKVEIQSTKLYQSLSEKQRNDLNNEVFKVGNFQLYFGDNNNFKSHIGWNDIYSLSKSNLFDGLYKYYCNMSHPSYIALIQFKDVYGDNDGIINFKKTIIKEMIAFMSVFIMDYMEEYPEIKYLYDNIDLKSKYIISLYANIYWCNYNKKGSL